MSTFSLLESKRFQSTENTSDDFDLFWKLFRIVIEEDFLGCSRMANIIFPPIQQLCNSWLVYFLFLFF